MNGYAFDNMEWWFGMHWLVMLFWLVLIVLPFWKIFSKAGYSGWFSLLMLIPLVNLIALYVLAFSNWPASRKDQ
jgi:hypothetical protein